LLPKLRTRLSFANVVSVLALFVALGGTSYAAITITGRNVKNSSLTGKDVKNSSLASADVKNRSLLAADFKTGQLPAGPQGAQGSQGPQGAKGDTGAAGTARGWAHVFGTGNVESSKNVEVASAGAGGGQYCVKTAFTPKVVVVTPEWEGTTAANNRNAHAGLGGFGTCTNILPGTNAYVVIQKGSDGTVVNNEFFLMADG
jgi:hypothetical protein